MAGALETLGGQAYGAEQYQKLGTYTYCSILSLITICLPVSLFWIFMDEFLRFMGQDPQISHVASIYSIWLIPALFGDAILQSLVRYFQSQSQILPLFLSSCATICFHVPLCWVLVHQTNLGYAGAALAITLALWFNVIVLGFYMRWSASCESTRTLILGEVFASLKEFLSYALPSAVMCWYVYFSFLSLFSIRFLNLYICSIFITMMISLEWWSFELLVLLSGLLPNSALETSVLSIWYVTKFIRFFHFFQ